MACARLGRLAGLVLSCLASVAIAAEAGPVEVITLADGRSFTGVYDEDAQTITLGGKVAATIRVPAAQIVKREPVAGQPAERATHPDQAAPGGDDPPLAALGGQVDPAVLAPLYAPGVPWESGDRLLIIGDLLVPPGQPELALRIHDALAKVTGKEIVVFSMQNHGLTLDRVAGAARDEIARRPPRLVLILAGVGDVVALLPPPAKPVPGAKPVPKPATPAPPAAPVKLPLPSTEAWRKSLADLVATAQGAGAAVVVATPAIVGDKPYDGPGAVELDAYAEAARDVADKAKAVLCELREPLVARLAERNPKGTRESGVLSKAPGQLKPEGMDMCAGLIAKALAEAVPRIPWTVDLPGGVFSGTTAVEVRTPRLAADQVEVHVTVDGSEPSERSPLYAKPIPLAATALVRVLAVAKDGSMRRTAQAWYMASQAHAADTVSETLPGLWVDHIAKPDWPETLLPGDALACELETWWPNCELGLLDRLPAGRRPAAVACLRYSGYFIAPSDGKYVFSLRSDGGARLFIGALPVARIDRDATARWQQGAVELARGHHAFTLFYGYGAGTPDLEVEVAQPGQRLRPLPDLLLRRPAQKPGGGAVEPLGDDGDATAPWTVRLAGGAFTGSTKAEVRFLRIRPEQVNVYYTTDGTPPSEKSALYSKPLNIGSTTRVRVLAVAKSGEPKVSAEAWYCETRKHPADAVAGETLPGLWVEHCTLKRWLDPVASIDTMRSDFTSAWPNGELGAFTVVPNHRWPNELFGLRFTGYFYAPVDGTYIFASNSDDASRITMGIVPVLRNDDMHPDRWQQAAVELTRGFHQLSLLYGQGPAIYTFELYAGLAGQRLQRLPDLLLRRPPQPPTRKSLGAEPPDDDTPAGPVFPGGIPAGAPAGPAVQP